MKGHYDVHHDLWFALDKGGRRGHDHKLFKRQFRLISRKYVFSNRVVDSWNSFSTHCINFSTINTFKMHVSSELKSGAIKF